MTEQTASPDRERSFSVRGTLLQAVNVRARIRRFSHAAQWRCQVLFSISAIHAGIVSIPSAFLEMGTLLQKRVVLSQFF